MSMSRAGAEAPPTRLVSALRSRSDWTEAPHISGRAVSAPRVWPPAPRLWAGGSHCLLSTRLGILKLSTFHIPSAGREVFLLVGNVA